MRLNDENALTVRLKGPGCIGEAYYTALIGKYINGYEILIASEHASALARGLARFAP